MSALAHGAWHGSWAVDRRPQLLRTFTDRTQLTGAAERIPGTAIYGRTQPLPFASPARTLGYRTLAVDGPHDMVITHPEDLAGYLVGVGDPASQP